MVKRIKWITRINLNLYLSPDTKSVFKSVIYYYYDYDYDYYHDHDHQQTKVRLNLSYVCGQSI